MKTALKIIVPIIVVLVGAFVTYRLVRPKYQETGIELKPLPEDNKLAQKEIANARLALSKLKPKGRYMVINTHSNILSLRTEDSVIFQGTCSTGSGGELIDSVSGRRWVFDTPRGIFKISSKIAQPWWRKPDWAFIEENEPIPKNESERLDPEMLGEYALGFGDGYFIHGTIYERLLGVSVTHGCVRLGSDDLKFIYEKTPIGTPLYIF
ncbi:MAG: L,D-transpeptidase [candidate division Zixibacteria bacterium]|nr:L,D-transpeptidase [candidate division Zixibacteria bacterium]